MMERLAIAPALRKTARTKPRLYRLYRLCGLLCIWNRVPRENEAIRDRLTGGLGEFTVETACTSKPRLCRLPAIAWAILSGRDSIPAASACKIAEKRSQARGTSSHLSVHGEAATMDDECVTQCLEIVERLLGFPEYSRRPTNNRQLRGFERLPEAFGKIGSTAMDRSSPRDVPVRAVIANSFSEESNRGFASGRSRGISPE